MVIPVPNQEYIDSVIQSIHQQTLKHEELCKLFFAVIEQFCAQVPLRQGPGRKKTYSDQTILKLDMLMHLTGKRGETEILREVERHYKPYFEKLPAQPRLWHRIRQALPLIERFRQHLRALLGCDESDLAILDTCPIPVAVPTSRPGRGNGFDWAEGGYCASKKLKYLGFKLGLLITWQGIPDGYDLFSARPHDVQVLNDLLGDRYDLIVLGDKGFVAGVKQTALATEQNVQLITYRRRNQKIQNGTLEQWVLHNYRQLIETVNSQLVDHMHLENCGAKTDYGLMKRVAGILTAFTLGIYLNTLLGRNLLAIKELFA
jgi:hypothetical protein